MPARVTRARLAAAMLDHQPGRNRQPVVKEGRVDAALEALAGIAGQPQFLAGPGDMLGIEVGAFDHDVGGRIGTRPNARRP